MFVFDPDELHACVAAVVAEKLPRAEAFDVLTARLQERYPAIDAGPRRWIFNNAGGAMGQMCLLYASLREYLIFFGTPIGTEGHSGRYATEVYDFVFDGEMECYLEGETERRTYGPGSYAVLRKNEVKGYRVRDRAWMLEYARGPIPLMLPFGLADTLFSTIDVVTAGRTLWHYGRHVVQSTLRRPAPAVSSNVRSGAPF